ncbi:MAG: hypothetical protein U0U66_03445 [Cytophagaceae bacterium]
MSFRNEVKDILLHTPAAINDDFWLEVFLYQYNSCDIYRTYADFIHKTPSNVRSVIEIPYLPVSFYKQFEVLGKGLTSQIQFHSSGTTGSQRSVHHVADKEWYRVRARQLLELSYGKLEDWVILAVLPSYRENPNSSLLFMLDDFMTATGHALSGYYPADMVQVTEVMNLMEPNKKVLLWGVTYALLDAAESGWKLPKSNQVTVMETGGMKGRRKELTREEVHGVLTGAWGVSGVHSEYGMTEMLSQLYSKGEGLFTPAPGVSLVLRDLQDPFTMVEKGNGGVNVMDAANIDACSFIELQDIGKAVAGGWEILGRIDQSDTRGCNLLYTG